MEILKTITLPMRIDPGVLFTLTERINQRATLTEIAIAPGFRLLEVRIGNRCVFYVRPEDEATSPIVLPHEQKDITGRLCTEILPGLDLVLRVERVGSEAGAFDAYVLGRRA